MRARAQVLCLTALLAFAAAPAGAFAASGIGANGFQKELTEAAPETETTTSSTATTGVSTETTTKNSSSVEMVVIIVAFVLLAGIAFVIVRDARRVAPTLDADVVGESSTARHSEAAMRRRRAKAKAARQQRKRNR